MADIFIYDEISKWWGISATEIVGQINEIEDSDDDEINLFINSPGGDIFQAVPIYNRLVRFCEKGGTVNAIVDGLAASAASWILMAADKISMYKNTTFFIHNGIGMAWGHKEDMIETAEYLKNLDSQIADMYVARTEIDKNKIVEMMNGKRGDGTSFTATEANDEGFIDELLDLSSKRSKSASNRHDFGASLNRLQIKNIPKNLIDESCSCSRCESRRGKEKNKQSIDRKVLAEQQRRSRMRNRIGLLSKR